MKNLRIIKDLSNDEYHSQKDSLSKSGMWDLLGKSARKFKMKYIDNVEVEQTKALINGDAIHKAVLEPELFKQEFVFSKKFDGRTKAGKEAKSKFKLENMGKKILEEDQKDMIDGIVKAINNAKCKTSDGIEYPLTNMFKDGIVEASIFGEDDGVNLRCRPDIFLEKKGICIDLKTTKDCNPESFAKDVAKYGYHLQAYMYSKMLSNLYDIDFRFLFVAVEKVEPFDIAVYELSPIDLELAETIYMKGLRLYKVMKEVNFEPKIEIGTLILPAYSHYRFENFKK